MHISLKRTLVILLALVGLIMGCSQMDPYHYEPVSRINQPPAEPTDGEIKPIFSQVPELHDPDDNNN